MIATTAALFCGAYILGLLLTGVPGNLAGIPLPAIGMLFLAIPIAFSIRRVWRMAPKPEVWLAASLIGVAAMLHFQIRLPQPSPTDICHAIRGESAVTTATPQTECQPTISIDTAQVEVTGTVVSPPRLTRSNRLQFELTATQISPTVEENQPTPPHHPVTGKVYVTVPRSAGEQLYPNLTVQVTGSLYKPKPATNPGGFDFEKYLAQQGIFAGLNGKTLKYPSRQKPDPPLFWSIRQRIRQVQSIGLGEPAGALVSAMVMGKDAVDVPYKIQDQFKQTGLAHALAASGAQVSLLIGVILALTQRLPNKGRLGLGVAVLIVYLGLTGLEPSVLRAGIMGFVALLALTVERKIKPVGSLLLTATLLLLLNPLWIWDLGFQLSFLATLGLLVTVPILTKWFDWMPTAIAPLFAVPIAAFLWTLPLLLTVFGIVSPYSILINILVSPLIAVISIGGMISAVGALIDPAIGSFLAGLLYFPTHLFLKIAEIGTRLPGNTFAVGTINTAQVLLLYGLIGGVWQWRRSHKYWWIAGLLGFSLIAIPAAYKTANLSQITVLATTQEPVLVVQDHGKVGLIHSGDSQDVEFSILPFLRQQGINRLDWAIAPDLKATTIASWQQILATESISIFYSSLTQAPEPLTNRSDNTTTQAYQALLAQVKATSGVALPLTQQPIRQGSGILNWMQSPSLRALQLQMSDQTWLLFSQLPDWPDQTALIDVLPSADVMAWSGKALSFKLLEHLNLKLAIPFEQPHNSKTEAWLKQHQVTLHSMPQQGAIQWTAQQGFVPMRSF